MTEQEQDKAERDALARMDKAEGRVLALCSMFTDKSVNYVEVIYRRAPTIGDPRRWRATARVMHADWAVHAEGLGTLGALEALLEKLEALGSNHLALVQRLMGETP